MTEQQAYFAMYEFLREYYARSNSDEIAILLSALSTLEDGRPADPAMLVDWRRAMQEVQSCEERGGYSKSRLSLG